MKVVEENKRKIIILETNEEIEVKTLKRNPVTIKIECVNGCLLVDEVSSSKIKDISIEQEQLEKLKQYNQKKARKKGKKGK